MYGTHKTMGFVTIIVVVGIIQSAFAQQTTWLRNVEIVTYDRKNVSYSIYNTKFGVKKAWDEELHHQSCNPLRSSVDQDDRTFRTFTIRNVCPTKTCEGVENLILNSVKVTSPQLIDGISAIKAYIGWKFNATIRSRENITLPPGTHLNVTVNYQCNMEAGGEEWRELTLEFIVNGNRIPFNYYKFCKSPQFMRIDSSVLILLLVACVALFWTSRAQRQGMHSLEDTRHHLSAWHVLVAMILNIIFIVVAVKIHDIRFLRLSFKVLIRILVGVILFFSIEDLLRRRIPRQRHYLPLAAIFGVIISLALTLSWHFIRDWWIHSLIAILCLRYLLALFRVTNVKQILVTVVTAAICALTSEELVSLLTHSELLDEFDLYYDPPTNLMVPKMDKLPIKYCSTLDVINLVFPGLLLSFAHHFDYVLKAQIYYRIGFVGFIFGVITHVACLEWLPIKLPPLIPILPPMLICIFFIGFWRNEHKRLWNGLKSEYDAMERLLEASTAAKLDEGPSGPETPRITGVLSRPKMFEGLRRGDFIKKI